MRRVGEKLFGGFLQVPVKVPCLYLPFKISMPANLYYEVNLKISEFYLTLQQLLFPIVLVCSEGEASRY